MKNAISSLTKTKILWGAFAASAAIVGTPASASVTFTGYATGCFTTTSCSPSTTAQTGLVVQDGSTLLSYNTSTQDAGTALQHSSFTTTTVDGLAGFSYNDLGYFSLGPNAVLTNDVFTGQIFDLLITFVAPPGTQSADLMADLTGHVVSTQGGQVTIHFDNDTQANALQLNYPGGTFGVWLNDVTLSPNGAGNTTVGVLTGGIQALPEPATWAMMLIGFAGVGAAMRRSRKPALAQLA